MILEIACILNANSIDWSTLLTIASTIGIALLAGLIALYQIKLNVISSARINWMENLRISISEYCALTGDILVAIKNIDSNVNRAGTNQYPDFRKDYDNYAQLCSRQAIQRNRVYLYLNSDNPIHKKIESTIDTVNDILMNHPINTIDNSVIMNYQNDIVSCAKIIFKNEWKKANRIFKA